MRSDLIGFPLTRQQRDTPQGIELTYWLAGIEQAFVVQIPAQEAVFFVCQKDLETIQTLLQGLPDYYLKPLALKDLRARPVAGLYSRSLKTWRAARERLQQAGIAMMEEDIRPVDRYLTERFIFSGAQAVQTPQGLGLRAIPFRPKFRYVSLDIETRLHSQEVLSIALHTPDLEKVLLQGRISTLPYVEHCADEKALLLSLQAWIQHLDPDLIIGWNLIEFDLKILLARAKKCGVTLRLGRDEQALRLELAESGRAFARLSGRVALDGIALLKSATWQFASFSLESVAQALLGRGKAIQVKQERGREIQRLYEEDPDALVAYNLEDTRLVSDIFAQTELIDFLIERSGLTGLPLDKMGGSAQAFDNLYLPSLHRSGYVAPEYASGLHTEQVPGGFVMESRPGLYQHILVLDFKSLYPSIIRTFLIDPLGLCLAEEGAEDPVPGFLGAQFARQGHLLPQLIERLWQARDEAKRQNKSALSQAIKIQMNACYGVLGSHLCRFFDQRLSASITLRGHQILTETADYLQDTLGYSVIYGDTDSVFVWLQQTLEAEEAEALGRSLAERLTQWWQARLLQQWGLNSALELEYEAHYERFLMPKMRHSEQGSKKRYAGLKVLASGQKHLVFKGLEQVRSDWTPLARQFQQTLFERVFTDQPWLEWLQETVMQLLSGESDALLIYQRRLRRPPEAYVKSRPPHVRAARRLNAYYQSQGWPLLTQGDSIGYLITLQGAEPAELRQSPIDYQHYLDKQLRPVADTLLPFLGTSFDECIQPQLSLF